MMYFKLTLIIFFCSVVLGCKTGNKESITTEIFSQIEQGKNMLSETLSNNESITTAANSSQGFLQNKLTQSVVPPENGVYYEGYAKEFRVVKKALHSGDINNLHALYQERLGIEKYNLFDPQNSDLDLLKLTELADLYLLEKNTDAAINSFSEIEQAFADQEDESIFFEKSRSFFNWVGDSVSGSAHFSDYYFQDFEKVLMLNLKSIAYLLEGNRKAYNVTRKAIDMQNKAREKFSADIKDAKSKLTLLQQKVKQKQIEEKNKAADTKNSPEKINHALDRAAGFKGVLDLSKNLNKYFLASDRKGAALPSAYVNPFGDYMNGIVQEFDSLKNPALRSNAIIAYKKALDLNPKSKVIKQNISVLKSRHALSTKKRLIHFIVGDGFAPEKKVLQYAVPAATGFMLVKLPLYESEPYALAHRIDIKTVSGKTRLARMSVISNIDALCLRSQKDRRDKDFLDLSATVTRTFFEKSALSGLGAFGLILGSIRDDYTEADTRSWLSLPSSLSAARMSLSKSIKKVRIIAYDKRWRRIVDKVIDLPAGHGFVYARIIGKSLYINKSDKLWIDS